jgi:RHS repeat-associated protein
MHGSSRLGKTPAYPSLSLARPVERDRKTDLRNWSDRCRNQYRIPFRIAPTGSGNVIDHIDYDGFGNVTNETQPSNGDRWKSTGRELDGETGLQYNRRRYYDGKAGRWTTESPTGLAAGDGNLFRYAGNAPVVFAHASMAVAAGMGDGEILRPNVEWSDEILKEMPSSVSDQRIREQQGLQRLGPGLLR